MKKQTAAILLTAALVAQPAAAQCLITGEDYGVGASAAIVMEAQSGEVLFAQNIHEQLPMASTTKIMTALLTLERQDLQEEFTVDDTAILTEGTSMGLQRGIPSRCTRWRSGCCFPAATTPPAPPPCACAAALRSLPGRGTAGPLLWA